MAIYTIFFTPSFLSFVLISFGLSLLPYICVSIYIIFDTENKRSSAYFGDGSVIILSSAIACNYFTSIFLIRNNEEEKTNQFIGSFLVILYAISLWLFHVCQTNTRSLSFNVIIIIISSLYLVVAFHLAIYDKYLRTILYTDEANANYKEWEVECEEKSKKINQNKRFKGFQL